MLELKNIVKKYGNNVILDDISLQIKKGEIVSILGAVWKRKDDIIKSDSWNHRYFFRKDYL